MNQQYQTASLILGTYLFVMILLIMFDPNTQDIRDKFKRIWKKK